MTLCVVFKRTNKKIEEAISLASDIILNPSLKEEDIEKEKGVILKELKLSTDKRETLVAVANKETMAKEPSFLAYSQIKVLGDEKIINSMTRNKLIAYKKNLFMQNNFVCSVTTSLSKRKIKKLICENLYNHLPFTEKALPEQTHIANKKSNVRVITHERENKFSYMLTFAIDKPYDLTRTDWNYSFASSILRKYIIRELRENAGLKQEFMAELLNISPANYCKKENGTIKCSLPEAKKIADYFGKTIEEVFFADEVSKIDTL